MKIEAIHKLECGKAGTVAPGTKADSRELGLSDELVKTLEARGALRIIPADEAKAAADAEAKGKQGKK